MTIGTFVAFWAVSFLFVITPGADWAYAISAGLRGRFVTAAVGGLLVGHLVATAIVAVGVGGLVANNRVAMLVLTTAGASYLLWLGINTLISPALPQSDQTQDSDSWLHWATKGACVSGLNPKVFLLFLALLPQFTEPAGSWPVPVQIVALGLVHSLSCGVVYLLVGFGSQVVLTARPAAARFVSRLSGTAMIIIAALLLIQQFVG